MMTGTETSGISIAMPFWCLLCAKAVSADGLACVKARMAFTTAVVRFSIAYSAPESVATAWTVAWCGIIFGRVDWLRLKARPDVVVLAMSERVLDARDWVRLDTGVSAGASADGSTTPDRAWKMSATGGSGSDQGTVKRGLSQRLWVLGSS